MEGEPLVDVELALELLAYESLVPRARHGLSRCFDFFAGRQKIDDVGVAKGDVFVLVRRWRRLVLHLGRSERIRVWVPHQPFLPLLSCRLFVHGCTE